MVNALIEHKANNKSTTKSSGIEAPIRNAANCKEDILQTVAQTLQEHPFLSHIKPEYLQYYEECASIAAFKSGDYLVKEKGPADDFFLIRSGRVALDTFIAGRGPTNIQYLTDGEVLGWSWLVEPHVWHFNALAVTPTETIHLNGSRLKELAEQDCGFGYDLMKRMVNVVGSRLRMTMLQLK